LKALRENCTVAMLWMSLPLRDTLEAEEQDVRLGGFIESSALLISE